MSAVWQEFQTLLKLCPQNRLEQRTDDGVHQVYRWVHDLRYQDDEGRTWKFHAIVCEETVDDQTTTFAWITDLHVSKNTVIEVATKGGRQRWHIENQGFNTQKNSGLNLEHAYSHGPQWAAYYYLLQIAHMLLQLLEKGSLLRQLAVAEHKRSPLELFGSLKNMAERLLESVRYWCWPEAAYDTAAAASIQIRLNDSS